MVKLFGISGIFFLILALATHLHYKNADSADECQIRILTSSSFYTGVGKDLHSLYKNKHDCNLKFDVVNGANLISNLFLKQPNRFDVLLGLDVFQIEKINNVNILAMDYSPVDSKLKYKDHFFVYDEAPLTFFLKNSKKNEFIDLKEFVEYLILNKLSVAVPLKTTSVLGALYTSWVQSEYDNDKLLIESNPIKYVKSWSEAIGLFERNIVDGFLSFETSEIYFANSKDIHKVSLSAGHPNLKEYFAFSKLSKMSSDQKKQFIEFIYSEQSQNLFLIKNYMWPAAIKTHPYAELRNLKVIDIQIKDQVL